MCAKSLRSQSQFGAATRLLEGGFCNEAVTLLWLSVRRRLFEWLEEKEVSFTSTRGALGALGAAISQPELSEVRVKLCFAYTIGTMSEWDEGFSVSPEEALSYRGTC